MKPTIKYGAQGTTVTGLALVIYWLWSEFVPGHPMTPEVAIALVGVLTAVVGRYLPASDRTPQGPKA